MNAIEIKNLHYSYKDGSEALAGIDLQLIKGKRIAILGANGSGKTTLLYHLNGIFLSQQGSIKVLNLEMNKKNRRVIREKVGIVFDQVDYQLFASTVFNDIAFGPRNLGLNENIVSQKVNEVMSLLDIKELADKSPANLSWGQKKKVAIAGVLAMEPDILVMDEPLSGLDPASKQDFLKILQDQSRARRTIIISTHEVDFAYQWAEQIIILAEGNVLASGEVKLLRDQELMQKAKLEIPELVQMFSEYKLYPRTFAEAKKMLKNLVFSGGINNVRKKDA